MTAKTFDIRQEPGSNPANLLLSNYAFSSSPKVPDKEKDERYLKQRSDDKIFFSYLENEPVAKVAITPMSMNVRGKVMEMGGICGVASMPIARRGGHIRALMTHSIEQMHADGQAVSALYPFKASYYEMFGYAGWQAPMWARIDPAGLAPYIKLSKQGTIQHRLSTDAKDDLHTFQQSALHRFHGMSTLGQARFDNGVTDYPTWFMSVHEGDEITGGITYKLDLDKEVMEARAVFWLTMNAKLHIFDFMARHVDQVKQIRMPILENESPYLWITNDDHISMLSDEDYSWGAPMARIVSLAGLNGIPVGDGEATITVSDPQAPWNSGTWTLRGMGGELEIAEGGTPGGEVSINGLSAMLFSGLDPRTLPYRNWGEVNTETSDALRSLFPAVTPYLHELF